MATFLGAIKGKEGQLYKIGFMKNFGNGDFGNIVYTMEIFALNKMAAKKQFKKKRPNSRIEFVHTY